MAYNVAMPLHLYFAMAMMKINANWSSGAFDDIQSPDELTV